MVSALAVKQDKPDKQDKPKTGDNDNDDDANADDIDDNDNGSDSDSGDEPDEQPKGTTGDFDPLGALFASSSTLTDRLMRANGKALPKAYTYISPPLPPPHPTDSIFSDFRYRR